ncbi:MAG: hypothetical protein H7249_05825 [Chitinophagaceae bacterium]|nr:hypothetical protein [Oligoflexus sp.]
MKNTTLTFLLSLSSLSTACDGTKFAGAKSETQAFQVRVSNPESASTSGSDAIPSTPASTVQSGIKTKAGSSDNDEKESLAECSKLTGVAVEAIKVAGSENDILLDPHQAFVLRETGNKNSIKIDFKATPENPHVKAICVFIAGNQNEVRLNVANHIDSIFVVMRGNHASMDIATVKGSVIDSIEMDAKGNGGQLVLSGEGQFPCDKGNQSIHCN